MHVLVTGGGGRLGCALVRALLARGDSVRVLEPGKGVPASLAGLEVDLVHGSVLEPPDVAAAVEGMEAVYHLAAKVNLDRDRDGSIHAVNVQGTRHVAEACAARGIRMLHCSSHHALVLAPLNRPLDETKPLALDERCHYHRSKAQGEQLVHDLIRERGLDAVVINPGTMVGPYDYEPSLFGRGLIDLSHGRLPALLNVVTDCVDARDVAAGAIAAMEHGRCGERYLLSGETLDMAEIAAAWSRVSGAAVPRINLPLWVAWTALPFTLGAARVARREPLFTPNMLRHSVTNDVVDCSKADRELGYSPRPLHDSLADTYTFFSERGWLPAPSGQ